MFLDLDKLRECWSEMPYGTYLNAVDDLLEGSVGNICSQAEMAMIADSQEDLMLPSECAQMLIKQYLM